MSSTSGLENHYKKYRRAIAMWLWVCLAMVVLMVFVGGLTRLTDSGLSMVNWHPIHGAVPPQSYAEWVDEFVNYQHSPEYQKKNFGMELDEFKRIFYWEYGHRLLGRFAGLVFVVPLIIFTAVGALRGGEVAKFMGIFMLGGLQAVIGWVMVQSGLADQPNVSPYKLALHLSTALLLGMLLLWQALNYSAIKVKKQKHSAPGVSSLAVAAAMMISLQIIIGAFVAGNDAGLTYNTFPLMDGKWIPGGLWHEALGIRNLFENITTVQFIHRITALLVLGTAFDLFRRSRHHAQLSRNATVLLLLVVLQMVIGIATLLLVVPVALASLHQMTAVALLAYSLFINWKITAINKS